MMFDFDRKTSKFEVEQQKRREEARKRKEREQKAEAAQKLREAQLAELAIKRKEEQEAAEEAQRIAEAEENQLTGGVKFDRILTPYFTDIADDDKIILSEEELRLLTEQDVFGKRPALFRLTATLSDGTVKVTHSGVREFSGNTNTVGLTAKIIQSLSPAGAVEDIKALHIKYVVLPKVTYVQLQPKQNVFFEVQPIKRMLEENLQLHATLTMSDVLTVWYRGARYQMGVTQLKPSPLGGSLLDTDVEVDLQLSEEFEKQNQGKKVGNTIYAPNPPPPPALSSSFSSSTTMTSPQPSSLSSGPAFPSFINSLELENEPASSAEHIVVVKFKLPSGSMLVRRFLLSSSLRQIFLFIIQSLSAANNALDYSQLAIVRRVPGRTWTLIEAEEGRSIGESGLGPQAETLFVKI